MNRYASVQLRRFVDDAVGRHHDTVFARLDALVGGRCGCAACHARLLERCAALVADLPPLRALPSSPDR